MGIVGAIGLRDSTDAKLGIATFRPPQKLQAAYYNCLQIAKQSDLPLYKRP